MVAEAIAPPTTSPAGRGTALPRQTLSGFVAGPENTHAYAACLAAARGSQAGIITITGARGLGKTHLLKGVARRLMEREGADPTRVLYVTGEGFGQRVTHHIRRGLMLAFRGHHRRVGCLLVDDVEGVGRGEGQAELKLTMDQIVRAGGLVVIASRTPVEKWALARPILDAAQGGHLVTLQEPTLGTLRAICRQMCAEAGLVLAEADLLHVASAVRLLCDETGQALLPTLRTTVARMAQRRRAAPHMAAADLLEVVVPTGSGGARTPAETIITATCAYYGLSRAAVLSKRRDPWTVECRQMLMWLLATDGGLGVTRVGRELGRDHSTVLHGVAQINKALGAEEPTVTDAVADIRKAVIQQGRAS